MQSNEWEPLGTARNRSREPLGLAPGTARNRSRVREPLREPLGTAWEPLRRSLHKYADIHSTHHTPYKGGMVWVSARCREPLNALRAYVQQVALRVTEGLR